MLTSKDLLVGKNYFYTDEYNRKLEVQVKFVNEKYCGVSRINEKSIFLTYYKDNRLTKIEN